MRRSAGIAPFATLTECARRTLARRSACDGTRSIPNCWRRRRTKGRWPSAACRIRGPTSPPGKVVHCWPGEAPSLTTPVRARASLRCDLWVRIAPGLVRQRAFAGRRPHPQGVHRARVRSRCQRVGARAPPLRSDARALTGMGQVSGFRLPNVGPARVVCAQDGTGRRRPRRASVPSFASVPSALSPNCPSALCQRPPGSSCRCRSSPMPARGTCPGSGLPCPNRRDRRRRPRANHHRPEGPGRCSTRGSVRALPGDLPERSP